MTARRQSGPHLDADHQPAGSTTTASIRRGTVTARLVRSPVCCPQCGSGERWLVWALGNLWQCEWCALAWATPVTLQEPADTADPYDDAEVPF
jgi:hypothetical protein